MASFRLGTRGSRLALAQANSVRAQLMAAEPGREVEIVTIKTSGDRGERDGLGVFVREIQEALLRNEIDAGLHCLKDLPTQAVAGLALSAYLPREDARDALIGHVATVAELPQGAVVGSGSLRRTAQLAAIRPDLKFLPLMGNVDTRLRKLQDGEYDAIILAIAGLIRLGVVENWASSEYASLIVSPLSVEAMTPAPGQAVLVLETRSGDEAATEWTSKLNHPLTQACAVAERAFLSEFDGGCSVPVGAYATANSFTGLVASPDGKTVLRQTQSAETQYLTATARDMATVMLAQGAKELYNS